MTTSPTSYLQTLPSDEVTAFVASLLKVKQHLNHEIGWFSEQLQQKTVQLQGIEALLAESGVESTIANVGSILAGNTAPISDRDIPSLDLAPSLGSPGQAQVSIATLDLEQPAQSAKLAKGKQPRSKLAAQLASKTSKKGRGPAKSKAQTPKSSPETQVERSELRQFLQPQFRDTPLSAAIAQVLEKASEPLSPDNIASELYEGLSSEDYGRAKRSLVSVLSLGRSKGKWKSPGRGLYESATAASA